MNKTDITSLFGGHDYAIVAPRSTLDDNPIIETMPLETLAPLTMRHPQDINSLPSLVSLTSLDAPHIAPLLENTRAAFDPETHPSDRPRPLIDCLFRAPSGIKPAVLLDHLSSRLTLYCVKRKEWGILRYDRTDTFLHLRRILRSTWLASLYGPILEWTFPFQGEWISFQPPEIDREKEIIPTFWNVDGPTRDRIIGIEYVNKVLAQFESETEDAQGTPYRWPDMATWDHAAAIAERSLANAAAYGLDDEDMIPFAVHALCHSEHFHLDIGMQHLLQTRGERRYRDITQPITPAQWKKIASPYGY
jgi:hypothetical protein